MNLDIYDRNGIAVITVPDTRIDAAVAIQFKDAMRAATSDGSDRVVLDMSEVLFVDSSGLGAIVASMKQVGNQRRLDLAGLTPDVAKVFQLTRMDSVFQIFDTVDEAVDLREAG